MWEDRDIERAREAMTYQKYLADRGDKLAAKKLEAAQLAVNVQNWARAIAICEHRER